MKGAINHAVLFYSLVHSSLYQKRMHRPELMYKLGTLAYLETRTVAGELHRHALTGQLARQLCTFHTAQQVWISKVIV